MPTPFSHLYIATQLLSDESVSPAACAIITAQRPAFLLGSIVADARPQGGQRADTHFYHYTEPMPDNPWREMFRQHPSLNQAQSSAHLAFLLGYVAHLASDEYWSRHMLKPHFAQGNWGRDHRQRFMLLHLLLIHMDERDEARLPQGSIEALRQTEPDNWLPFLSDATICEWRDFIAQQLEAESETLTIFGGRIGMEVQQLRELLDDAHYMQWHLWQHIPQALLHQIESDLYRFAREQMEIYLRHQPNIS